MQLTISLVVALLLVPVHGITAPLHSRETLLPTCKSILAKLSHQQVEQLRDAVQVLGQHTRKLINWQWFYDRKVNPPTDVSEQHAYNTTLTKEELQERRDKESRALEHEHAKLEDMIRQLRTTQLLDANVTNKMLSGCVYGRANMRLYENRPKVSFLMQYFKRPKVIQPFIERLKGCQALVPIELVVNVDHPQEHEAWATASYATEGLVVPVFSNNVHEVRSYNRLAHLARGDILILMADDDILPEDCSWLPRVLQLFERWPDVGVVGIRNYVICFNAEKNGGVWFKDPLTGQIAHWVQRVDMAPMAIRRQAYMHVGGFDETLTEPGECGIITDWEICHRMWISGWQVMATEAVRMEHHMEDGESGTHKPQTAHRCWGKQQGIVGHVMSIRTDQAHELEMCEAARQLNLKHLEMVDPAQCPFRNGCKL